MQNSKFKMQNETRSARAVNFAFCILHFAFAARSDAS